MLRLDRPVPGIPTEPRTPDPRTFIVNWNGPSLIDLLNDFTPRSVMLKPPTVLSKLNALRLRVILVNLNGFQESCLHNQKQILHLLLLNQNDV